MPPDPVQIDAWWQSVRPSAGVPRDGNARPDPSMDSSDSALRPRPRPNRLRNSKPRRRPPYPLNTGMGRSIEAGELPACRDHRNPRLASIGTGAPVARNDCSSTDGINTPKNTVSSGRDLYAMIIMY